MFNMNDILSVKMTYDIFIKSCKESETFRKLAVTSIKAQLDEMYEDDEDYIAGVELLNSIS